MHNYPIDNSENNRGEKTPPSKKNFDFKLYKKNTFSSLYDVEHFLNNFSHYSKYYKIFKIFK